MSAGDLLANVERTEHDRPRAVAPVLPDLVPDERPWVGSVHSEVEHWRARALAAEGLVVALQRALLRHRLRP